MMEHWHCCVFIGCADAWALRVACNPCLSSHGLMMYECSLHSGAMTSFTMDRYLMVDVMLYHVPYYTYNDYNTYDYYNG